MEWSGSEEGQAKNCCFPVVTLSLTAQPESYTDKVNLESDHLLPSFLPIAGSLVSCFHLYPSFGYHFYEINHFKANLLNHNYVVFLSWRCSSVHVILLGLWTSVGSTGRNVQVAHSTWLVADAGSWVGPQLELWAMGLSYLPCGFSVWLGLKSKHSKRKEVEADSPLKAWAWKFHNIPSGPC